MNNRQSIQNSKDLGRSFFGGHMNYNKKSQLCIILMLLAALFLSITMLTGCNGSAKELVTGASLGAPVIGDGETRSDGADFGQIYTVTQIVEATPDIASWSDLDLPFQTSGGTYPRRPFGNTTLNSQWPFEFGYSYPANNYKLGEAHLVFVTQRDNSDTEAIFVDGVMTGRPPGGSPSTTSTKITHRNYSCPTCTGAAVPTGPANTYYMDWALTHYKIGTPNSIDLNVADLLTPTTVTAVSIINDGVLRVVSGDDAAIFEADATKSRPILLLEGFTISKTALTCSKSLTYKFTNTYIHNDGNSIGQPAFSGTVVSPVASCTPYASCTPSAARSVEFFYDPRLPRVNSIDNITLSTAQLKLRVKRVAGASAIVINGVGVAEAGFDRNAATAAVESWDDSAEATTAWSNFLAGIPANGTDQANKILDLNSLLGASKVRELLAQGKLNVSIAGGLATVYGQAATSTRTYGTAVDGPDLILVGTYFTEVCQVPDNPNSPLSDSSGAVASCDLDSASPIASSIQVASITSTSAVVQWLTNEPSDSQVGYGAAGPTTDSSLDATQTTFHSVTITGLQPYTYYQYNVKSKDGCNNQTISSTRSFRTLR